MANPISEICMTPYDVVLLTTALRRYISHLERNGLQDTSMQGSDLTRGQMAARLLTHYTDAVSDMIAVEAPSVLQGRQPVKGK